MRFKYSKDGSQFTYPSVVKGWVDLGDLIMPRPGIKPVTTLTESLMPNAETTAEQSHKILKN